MRRGGQIALRYARALFGLGESAEHTQRMLEELDELCDLVEGSEELRRVLYTPLHPRAERRGVVEELARTLELSKEVRAFAAILVDENRTRFLPAIRDAYRELVERAAGRLEARVLSARPLDEAQVERIREALSQRVRAQVTLSLEVDERLIGGVVARVGDLLLDGSLRTQLEVLRESLRKGSS